MSLSTIDWEAVDRFLEALGRTDARLVFTIFPPKQGPCIHIACDPGNISRDHIAAALARRPRYSLGLIINPPKSTPDDWGAEDHHYYCKPDGTRGRLKIYGAQQDHIFQGVAIWAEADGGLPIEAQEALPELAGMPEPTFSVWSGGKSLHHYWVFTPGQEVNIDLFGAMQKRLAHAIHQVAPDAQVDDSLSNANRVMRCPGASHPATNELARFHHESGITYTPEELDVALPALPLLASGSYDGTRPQTLNPLSRWFCDLPERTQYELAVDLLSLIPPRQAPGTGTYPQAFATLAALVHHFGADEAIAICDEAKWHNEHWNPTQKVRSIGPARFVAPISTLITRAQEESGWVKPEHLPPFLLPDQEIIDGFDVHQQTVAEPIPEPPNTSAPKHRILTRHDCRNRLERAVDDDLGPADLELLIDELASNSDLTHFTLRALLSAIRTQAEQFQAIQSEAESLGAPLAPPPQDKLRLSTIFPPITAYALKTLTQYLPYSEAAIVMAFMAGMSGLTKLGTSVCGNPITQYIVPTNLYVATVANTGQKKTPLQKITIENPTKQIRLDLAKANSRAYEQWREQCQGMKKDERPPQPTPLYLHVQDYTGEALADQLQALDARGQSIMVLRDELSGLFGSLNAYRSGRGADEQQLLELFDGLPYTALRVASGDRSFSRCHVSIYGGIQPEVLKALIRGGDPSGKWARFLFSPLPRRTCPLPTTISVEQVGEIEESNQMLANVANTIYTLPPKVYQLDGEALHAFSDYEHLKQQQALSARLQAQQAVHGKAGGKVLRVAGLLHVLWACESGGAPLAAIPYATLQMAIDVVEAHDNWALTFHEAALADDGSPVSSLMRLIHATAQRIGGPSSWREVAGKLTSAQRKGLNVEVAKAAMQALAEHGYGTVEEGARGGLTYVPIRDLPQS
jgi:hypothetical protein